MRQRTLARLRQLESRFALPPGCPACANWPHVWLIGEGDPEPPLVCGECGRAFEGLIRVYIGLRLDGDA